MGRTANIIIKDVIHIFASISKIMRILLMGRRNRERWTLHGTLSISWRFHSKLHNMDTPYLVKVEHRSVQLTKDTQHHLALMGNQWDASCEYSELPNTSTGLDIRHLINMPVGHMVLKIYVPNKNFHVPSQYLYKPCKAYVYCWENKYIPRLKNHLPSRKLPVYTTATRLLFGRESDQNHKCTETTPRWETCFVTMWNK